jgi:hypothetical protein
MNIKSIDEAIEKYAMERMEKGKEKASERFLAYAYLKHGGDEIMEFLLKVSGLSRYYIEFLKGMENPFKGPEFAWFAVMLAVGIYGFILMAAEDSRLLGIVLLAGTLVHTWSLLRMVTYKMREIGLRIAIYREIVQIVEKEIRGKA